MPALPASLEALINSESSSLAALQLAGKIVENIIKNPGDPKYCRINLAGKAGSKLLAAPASVEYLKSVGFVESDDGHLQFPVGAPGLEGSLVQLQCAMSEASSQAVPAPSRPSIQTSSLASDPTAGMSLKQKAVYLQDQKAKAEKEDAKRLREEQLAKLKQDKIVRAKDENWKPAAAGVKGGVEVHRTQVDNTPSGG